MQKRNQRKNKKNCRQHDQNNDGRPSDDVLNFIINKFSHRFFVINDDDHGNQNHRQQNRVYDLGPDRYGNERGIGKQYDNHRDDQNKSK